MWRAGVYNVQLVEAVIREALLHLERLQPAEPGKPGEQECCLIWPKSEEWGTAPEHLQTADTGCLQADSSPSIHAQRWTQHHSFDLI